MAHYVDSEVSRLATVMLHRPGAELARLTPRNNDSLLFDGIPWVGRAQEEHDAFAAALRERGVEVLYLGELLEETLAGTEAREALTASVLDTPRLGDTLRERVAAHLADLGPRVIAVSGNHDSALLMRRLGGETDPFFALPQSVLGFLSLVG